MTEWQYCKTDCTFCKVCKDKIKVSDDVNFNLQLYAAKICKLHLSCTLKVNVYVNKMIKQHILLFVRTDCLFC